MCANLVHCSAMRAGFGLPGTAESYNVQVSRFCQADKDLLEVCSFSVWQELPFHIASRESAYMPYN